MFRNFLLFQFLLGLFLSVSAQNNYTPLEYYKVPEESAHSLASKYLKPEVNPDFDTKAAKNAYYKVCENRYNYFLDLANHKKIMANNAFTQFAQSVCDSIIKNNPELKPIDAKVFIKRSESCNASSLDEGVILIHLGLLERLETVDQLAFVIGHELAHDYLNHVYSSMEKMAVVSTNKKLQKEIKNASKQEYGSNTKVSSIMLGLLSKQSLHSRYNEYSADSLGVKFSVSAGFNIRGSYEVLQILKESDYIKYLNEVDVSKHLNTKRYPFDKEWLKSESNSWSSMDYSLFDIPDSLRSHPHCDKRHEKIRRQDAQLKNKKVSSHALNNNFQYLKNNLPFESVQSLMDKGFYSLAMYYAIHLLEKNPNHIYLLAVISDCQISIAKSLMDRSFSYHVDFPSDHFPKSYNDLLHYLHNMNSGKLKKQFKAMYQEKLLPHLGDPYIDYLAIINKSLLSEEDHTPMIEFYKTRHKNEIYNNRLNDYFNN